jgi:hypothetical protein
MVRNEDEGKRGEREEGEEEEGRIGGREEK